MECDSLPLPGWWTECTVGRADEGQQKKNKKMDGDASECSAVEGSGDRKREDRDGMFL